MKTVHVAAAVAFFTLMSGHIMTSQSELEAFKKKEEKHAQKTYKKESVISSIELRSLLNFY